MNKAKFLYIDDEAGASTDAIKDGLNDTEVIHVTHEQAIVFEKQLSAFESKLGEYDGLILDLRLDDNVGAGLKHTAVSLAQELRTKTAAKEKYPDLPIILCSTDEKIKALYNRDQTSHDLFDYEFIKSASPKWHKIATRLKAISEGYKTIAEDIHNLNRIFDRKISNLNPRIFGEFLDKGIQYPVHELAQHIIKELIRWPGPLVGEQILASKLGVDIEKSSDWKDFLSDHIPKQIKYTGVFSDGWNRWWADLLGNWFNGLSAKRLTTLEAEERVSLIKKKTGLQSLVAAKPLPKSVSTKYSTICSFFKVPLDPLEGFILYSRKEPRTWQDHKYLSIEAVLERKGISEGFKIHPFEEDRVAIIKESLSSRK